MHALVIRYDTLARDQRVQSRAVLLFAGLLIALMRRSLGRENSDVTIARTIEGAIAARLSAS
jgi:hypothetical protein